MAKIRSICCNRCGSRFAQGVRSWNRNEDGQWLHMCNDGVAGAKASFYVGDIPALPKPEPDHSISCPRCRSAMFEYSEGWACAFCLIATNDRWLESNRYGLLPIDWARDHFTPFILGNPKREYSPPTKPGCLQTYEELDSSHRRRTHREWVARLAGCSPDEHLLNNRRGLAVGIKLVSGKARTCCPRCRGNLGALHASSSMKLRETSEHPMPIPGMNITAPIFKAVCETKGCGLQEFYMPSPARDSEPSWYMGDHSRPIPARILPGYTRRFVWFFTRHPEIKLLDMTTILANRPRNNFGPTKPPPNAANAATLAKQLKQALLQGAKGD